MPMEIVASNTYTRLSRHFDPEPRAGLLMVGTCTCARLGARIRGPGYRVYYVRRSQRLIILLAGGDKVLNGGISPPRGA